MGVKERVMNGEYNVENIYTVYKNMETGQQESQTSSSSSYKSM